MMYEALDPILMSQLRLTVMSYLMVTKEADFNRLKDETGATSGNLSIQIGKLQEAGYIEVEKTYKNNYPLTICRLTESGIEAFDLFHKRLQTYFKQ